MPTESVDSAAIGVFMRLSKPSLFLIAHAASLAVLAGGVSSASAQVRVGQWNVTNWNSVDVATRGAAFQTSFYGIAPNGQQFAPDIITIQEVEQPGGSTAARQSSGQSNVTAFLNLLNTAPGSPGDWAAAPYVANGGDTGNALFYRTSKFQYISVATLDANTGTGPNQAPRDNQRWLVRLVGYSGAEAQVYIYSGHFKAGSTTADQLRREPEGVRLRADANALPPGTNFLLGADFNVQNSAQVAYDYLVGTSTTPGDVRTPVSGRFFDPIIRPGAWNGSCTFRNIHTQEPTSAATGGMDDRHDQILISAGLRDLQGMSYISEVPGGNIFAPFITPSSCTASASQNWWDDPNHSYRAWGNDGNHFNGGIADGGFNTQVGLTIANALITTCAGGGHLPVYLELQVPAKLGAPTGTINYGTVAQNATATSVIQITNAANVALYSRDGTGWGVDPLTYSFSITGPFTITGGNGPFNRTATAAPTDATSHTIVMDTSTSGTKTGTLTITSDDPDVPTRVITLTGQVGGGGGPPSGNFDVNGDGVVNAEDLYTWYRTPTDVNGDATINAADAALLRTFLRFFEVQDITAGRR